MAMDRRSFLKASSFSLATASLGGMASLLTSIKSQANENSDYKALVCLFFYGGMDNHDTVIPYDSQSYNRWADIRKTLLAQQSSPRLKENLLPLSPLNAAQFGGRQFALPQELSGIHNLFQTGNAAIIGNVGPLIEPTNASSFEEEIVKLPSRLFSHNDQQATWMSGATEGAKYGWAGLYADAIASKNSSGSNTFTNITTGGGELFLTGKNTTPYQVSGGRALSLDIIDETEQESFAAHLGEHFRSEYLQGESLLQQDMVNKIRDSFDANKQYNSATGSDPLFNTQFPATGLGSQLKSVTQSIAAREQLNTNRQVFIVAMGGFDTHSGQASTLPKLQTQIDEGVVAFYQAMTELGLQNDVTLFTASDFGRTLATNGDGTDHGWGSHHFVIGGGVQGQQILGDIPVADFGHELDAGSGRLIPTQSIDQYAAALGHWFGVGQYDIDNIFPNLTNLGPTPAIFG